jgi:plasmid stabilization system protein ParE
MKLEILAEAEEDLQDGIRFYESQSPGVGRYFFESLWADIRSLYLFAGIHARDRGYYRMSAKRFPFAVFYRVKDDRVLVHAVLDCRRNPDWIRRQLTRRTHRDER